MTRFHFERVSFWYTTKGLRSRVFLFQSLGNPYERPSKMGKITKRDVGSSLAYRIDNSSIFNKEKTMLQNIETSYNEQNRSSLQNETSTDQTSEYEISQFMKNFAQALCGGNPEEISTYYADGAQIADLPSLMPIIDVNDVSQANFNPLFLNQKISAEERFGVYSALICLRGLEARDYSDNGGWHLLTCVLDKTEGYWEIVQTKHGALV